MFIYYTWLYSFVYLSNAFLTLVCILIRKAHYMIFPVIMKLSISLLCLSLSNSFLPRFCNIIYSFIYTFFLLSLRFHLAHLYFVYMYISCCPTLFLSHLLPFSHKYFAFLSSILFLFLPFKILFSFCLILSWPSLAPIFMFISLCHY